MASGVASNIQVEASQKLRIFQSEFTQYEKRSIVIKAAREATLEALNFQGLDRVGASQGVSCSTCNKILFQNCIFSNLRDEVDSGAAILIRDALAVPSVSEYSFLANTFFRNSAVAGGAVYVAVSNKTIFKGRFEGNLFQENQAKEEGGAIYYESFMN